MRCKKVEKLMPAMAAGELPERLAAMVREHLDVCPSCAAELGRYEESLSALRQSRDRSVPDGLWNGFWEKIREEAVLPQIERPKVVYVQWRTVVRLAAAAAVLAAVFIGLAIMHRRGAPRPGGLEEKERPLMVKGIIQTPDAPVAAKDEIPRMYPLADMARVKGDTGSKVILPLHDISQERKATHHYTLRQAKLGDKDESQYEF